MSDTCEFFNVRDDLKSLSLDRVKRIQSKATLPYSIALMNFSGNLNVGMCIRTAVIFGAEKVFIIGKKKYDKRSTVGAHNYIDIEFINEDPNEYPHLAMNSIVLDYNPILIEQGGSDIYKEDFNCHEIPPCLIFGCESTGIPQSILDIGKQFDRLSIQQIGVIRSLNVSAAASIVMWKVSEDLKNREYSLL
jgi:tRNA G18 (ribose-2'-O)-methylase SpoU